MRNSLSHRNTPWQYQSYMLRLWREAADAPYRASLQAANEGEQLIFADVPALCTFLVQLGHAPEENCDNDQDVISPFQR